MTTETNLKNITLRTRSQTEMYMCVSRDIDIQTFSYMKLPEKTNQWQGDRRQISGTLGWGGKDER